MLVDIAGFLEAETGEWQRSAGLYTPFAGRRRNANRCRRLAVQATRLPLLGDLHALAERQTDHELAEQQGCRRRPIAEGVRAVNERPGRFVGS